MKAFHIGLDFGTSQSKACIYDVDNNVHEFFRFPDTNSFFISSKIGLKNDDTFEYGNSNPATYKNEYYYFKIASAEDEEFHAETFESTPTSKPNLYLIEEFYPFTPEFLSVIYLTHLLFRIKEHYKARFTQKDSGKGFIKKLFSASSKIEDIKFTVQLGIPTEWSQRKNLRRKRKFENILMIAELLQKKYKTHETYIKATSEELITHVKNIYKFQNLSNSDQFDDELNSLGISVFPETAAGLTFIIKTRQLMQGYYGIMDIGGGTTDISFFCVESGNSIKYLASESYLIAANTFYKRIANNEVSIHDLQKAEKEVQELIASGDWQNNKLIQPALYDVNKHLNKLVYKLFHRRVYHFRPGMVNRYADQPMLMYGGGSRLPGLDSGRIEIYNNGNVTSITIPTYFMEKQKIDRYTSIINVLDDTGSWKTDLSVLVVALGLSYIKPESFANWFGEEDYQPKDGKSFRKIREIQHPQNEDYYLYDVLRSKWSRS